MNYANDITIIWIRREWGGPHNFCALAKCLLCSSARAARQHQWKRALAQWEQAKKSARRWSSGCNAQCGGVVVVVLHCARLIVCCDKGIDKHKFFIAGSYKARGTPLPVSLWTAAHFGFQSASRVSISKWLSRGAAQRWRLRPRSRCRGQECRRKSKKRWLATQSMRTAIFSLAIFRRCRRKRRALLPALSTFSAHQPARSGRRLKKEILRGERREVSERGRRQTFWHPHVEFFHAAYHRSPPVKYELRYFGL